MRKSYKKSSKKSSGAPSHPRPPAVNQKLKHLPLNLLRGLLDACRSGDVTNITDEVKRTASLIIAQCQDQFLSLDQVLEYVSLPTLTDQETSTLKTSRIALADFFILVPLCTPSDKLHRVLNNDFLSTLPTHIHKSMYSTLLQAYLPTKAGIDAPGPMLAFAIRLAIRNLPVRLVCRSGDWATVLDQIKVWVTLRYTAEFSFKDLADALTVQGRTVETSASLIQDVFDSHDVPVGEPVTLGPLDIALLYSPADKLGELLEHTVLSTFIPDRVPQERYFRNSVGTGHLLRAAMQSLPVSHDYKTVRSRYSLLSKTCEFFKEDMQNMLAHIKPASPYLLLRLLVDEAHDLIEKTRSEKQARSFSDAESEIFHSVLKTLSDVNKQYFEAQNIPESEYIAILKNTELKLRIDDQKKNTHTEIPAQFTIIERFIAWLSNFLRRLLCPNLFSTHVGRPATPTPTHTQEAARTPLKPAIPPHKEAILSFLKHHVAAAENSPLAETIEDSDSSSTSPSLIF